MKKLLIITIIILFILIGGLFIFNIKTTNLAQSTNHATGSTENDVTNGIVVDTTNNIQNIEFPNATSLDEIYNETKYEGDFELPIIGSTGFTSVSLPLYKGQGSSILKNLEPGQAFKIIDEFNNYFKVELKDSTTGYIESKYCLVNLPDIIPSIIYDDTNSYKSIFRSSGYSLEDITGKKLYNVFMHNERLDQDEYIMPLLYPMTKKIAQVQEKALENGDCLKIYETYRPYEVQMKVSDSLSALMEENETVKKGITTPPWDKSWFIAVQLSNHQRGVALDVSLAKVQDKEYKKCGQYTYINVTKYDEYKMPTQMHELSRSAATFTSPVDSKSKTAWKNAKLASSMNENAKKLQNYFTSCGLTPLASEWWHFNDLDTRELTKDKGSNGKYYLKDCLSTIPD